MNSGQTALRGANNLDLHCSSKVVCQNLVITMHCIQTNNNMYEDACFEI